jgi:hypothetical protein
VDKYYKNIENGYITAISTGSGGVEITQEEYDEIIRMIQSRPITEAGYDYKLRTDLTWELVERPVDEDPDISTEEAMSIMLGVSE